MSQSRSRLISQFPAVDADGNEYIIYKYRSTIVLHPQGYRFPTDISSGAPYYRLRDNTRVNKLNETEFEIVGSGKKLRKLS